MLFPNDPNSKISWFHFILGTAFAGKLDTFIYPEDAEDAEEEAKEED